MIGSKAFKDNTRCGFPGLILSKKQSQKIDCGRLTEIRRTLTYHERKAFKLPVVCLVILDDHDFLIPTLMNFK